MRISDWSSDVCSSDLGTLRLGDLGSDEARQAGIAASADGFNRARTAGRGGLFEGGAADGEDQLRIFALDGRVGVAGVDRSGEALVALDRQYVRNPHHVEQRGDARRDILARRGGVPEQALVDTP